MVELHGVRAGMDQESYYIGFMDALDVMEQAIEDYMNWWHLHPASHLAEQLQKKIETFREEGVRI